MSPPSTARTCGPITLPPSVAPSLTYSAPSAPAIDVSGNATGVGKRDAQAIKIAHQRRHPTAFIDVELDEGVPGCDALELSTDLIIERLVKGGEPDEQAPILVHQQIRRHHTELPLQPAVRHPSLTAEHRNRAAARSTIELGELRLTTHRVLHDNPGTTPDDAQEISEINQRSRGDRYGRGWVRTYRSGRSQRRRLSEQHPTAGTVKAPRSHSSLPPHRHPSNSGPRSRTPASTRHATQPAPEAPTRITRT